VRAITLIVFLAAAGAGRVAAQVPRSPVIRLHTGLTLPTGPEQFSDYWNPGFGLGGGIGLPLTPTLSLEAAVSWTGLQFDETGFLEDLGIPPLGASIEGAGISILTVSANAIARLGQPGSRVMPYLAAGGGMMRLASGDISVMGPGGPLTVQGASETALLVEAAAGLEIAVGSSNAVFAEVRYGVGLTEDETTTFLPIRVGAIIR
jgi:hypothetical protein